MQKIILAALVAALVCTTAGCKPKQTADGVPSPGVESAQPQATSTAEETGAPTVAPEPTTPLPRVDVMGNPIETGYAEGTFVKIEDERLFLDENGKERQFALTERAKNAVSVLGIGEGARIIVNFNTLEDGTEEAESIEKIIVE